LNLSTQLWLAVKSVWLKRMAKSSVHCQHGWYRKTQTPSHLLCFKHVKSLPVNYDANKKAWMTSSIFKQWT
jgi:hypothetical protein